MQLRGKSGTKYRPWRSLQNKVPLDAPPPQPPTCVKSSENTWVRNRVIRQPVVPHSIRACRRQPLLAAVSSPDASHRWYVGPACCCCRRGSPNPASPTARLRCRTLLPSISHAPPPPLAAHAPGGRADLRLRQASTAHSGSEVSSSAAQPNPFNKKPSWREVALWGALFSRYLTPTE